MATKKDYEAIATILRFSQIVPLDYLHQSIATVIADYFESDNERFDRERFLKACGVSE